MTLSVRVVGLEDAAVLRHVADGVFDGPVDEGLAAEFLADSRHHIVVAREEGVVVGMATAVHYVHPDKAPELWIDEVGVAPGHRGAGLGRRLVEALLEHGRGLGCREAWVLTEPGNEPARRLYRRTGGRETEAVVMYSFDLEPT